MEVIWGRQYIACATMNEIGIPTIARRTQRKISVCDKEEQRGNQENKGSTCQGSCGQKSTRKDRPGKNSTGESYPNQSSNKTFSRQAGQGCKTYGQREQINFLSYFWVTGTCGSFNQNNVGNKNRNCIVIYLKIPEFIRVIFLLILIVSLPSSGKSHKILQKVLLFNKS